MSQGNHRWAGPRLPPWGVAAVALRPPLTAPSQLVPRDWPIHPVEVRQAYFDAVRWRVCLGEQESQSYLAHRLFPSAGPCLQLVNLLQEQCVNRVQLGQDIDKELRDLG